MPLNKETKPNQSTLLLPLASPVTDRISSGRKLRLTQDWHCTYLTWTSHYHFMTLTYFRSTTWLLPIIFTNASCAENLWLTVRWMVNMQPTRKPLTHTQAHTFSNMLMRSQLYSHTYTCVCAHALNVSLLYALSLSLSLSLSFSFSHSSTYTSSYTSCLTYSHSHTNALSYTHPHFFSLASTLSFLHACPQKLSSSLSLTHTHKQTRNKQYLFLTEVPLV